MSRDLLEKEMKAILPVARRNGPAEERLPNTLNMTLPGIRGEALVLALDREGVALSSGSACHAGAPEPSHALTAMGLSDEDAHCAVRFSLGHGNSEEEIERVVKTVSDVVDGRRSAVRFVSCR